MTQRAREEGRTEGVGDLADSHPHPTAKREATGETGDLRRGDPWNTGDPGAIFPKGYSVAKIKFKGEARKYSRRKDIVKL